MNLAPQLWEGRGKAEEFETESSSGSTSVGKAYFLGSTGASAKITHHTSLAQECACRPSFLCSMAFLGTHPSTVTVSGHPICLCVYKETALH